MTRFDAARVARFEIGVMRGYIERRKWRVFVQNTCLYRARSGVSLLHAAAAAYFTAWAYVALARRGPDDPWTHSLYERVYRLTRRRGVVYDPAEAATLALRLHSESGHAAAGGDWRPAVDAAAALHALIYGVTPGQARESAEWRVSATRQSQTITPKPPAGAVEDWQAIEEDLRRCYAAMDVPRASSA